MIRKLAIANRGEVAVRIHRACEELGIQSVLLHSESDVKSRAYRMTNQQICIGASPSHASYLNIENVIQGALASGADAIHPGFGFLSENSEFAQRVVEAGLKFVGPPAAAMKMLGDKVACKKRALKLGIPLIPGYDGSDQSVETLSAQANKLGLPVVVKAAAGGGGRGMKVIRNSSEAREQIESAQREAQAAFGSPIVFLEKYFERSRHIEVQIFVDSIGQVRHFFERDCSVQRRHQKIIEEAPGLPSQHPLRAKILNAAVQLVQQTGYQGAATVEFLVEGDGFYLLEVNTRLQVEHPVTEEICAIDLVKAQVQTAQGDFVFTDSHSPQSVGHAIECRIYAEDPYKGGIPSVGVLGHVVWPEGPGRRFEYGFDEGDEITTFYDSMIAKVIVREETRTRAIQKMKFVLSESVLFGVRTNIPLLLEILSHPDFVAGQHTTRFFDQHFSQPLVSAVPPENLVNSLQRISWSSEKSGVADPFAEGWRTSCRS